MTTAAATEDSIAPAIRQRPWPRVSEVVLIGLVFFIAAGDSPPHVNETHYLCRLKHFWNPSWCVGDLFLESSDTQVAFIWLFGWVTRFVSLTATAWIGRIITWALLAWAWQRLSWRLVPRPLASVLSAAIFVALNSLAHMAGEWVVGGVEAKCFAYVFVLLALREVIDGRWNLVWLMLGAATAFHPLVGGWSGVVCVGIWLIDGRREQRLLAMMSGFAAGGLLALVGIVPALALTWGQPAEIVSESSRIYVFDRLPHHLAPLTLPSDEVTRRLTGHAELLVALAAMCFVLWKLKTPRAKAWRRIAEFAWGAAMLACIGLAIELIFSNQPLIAAKLLRYYWFRLTDFAAPMTFALLTIELIAVGFERRRKWAPFLLTAALISTTFFLTNKAWPRYTAWHDGDKLASPSDSKAADLSLTFAYIQLRRNWRIEKAKFIATVYKDFFDENEIRKTFYDINYNRIDFNNGCFGRSKTNGLNSQVPLENSSALNSKSKSYKARKQLERDDSNNIERRIDLLLYRFNLLGQLVRRNLLKIDDLEFIAFEIARIFNNQKIKDYLIWVDKEFEKYGKIGGNVRKRAFDDARWLFEEFSKNVHTVGIPFIREQQYEQVKSIFSRSPPNADGKQNNSAVFLPETYKEWQEVNKEISVKLENKGYSLVSIVIEPSSFEKWCADRPARQLSESATSVAEIQTASITLQKFVDEFVIEEYKNGIANPLNPA